MTSQSNVTSNNLFTRTFNGFGLHRGYLYMMIILTALLAFETFNYSTTQFALSDLLGTLTFAKISWATILSIAFCGIDFAGIARLFTPDRDSKAASEVWYLFGAWILAAMMNAILTWWAVSLALENHTLRSTTVMDQSLLIKAVPVFVAIMVWLIRILVIGSISMTGDHLFKRAELRQATHHSENIRNFGTREDLARSYAPRTNSSAVNIPATSFQPIHRASIRQDRQAVSQPSFERTVEPAYYRSDTEDSAVENLANLPEPVYQPLSASSRTNHQTRQL